MRTLCGLHHEGRKRTGTWGYGLLRRSTRLLEQFLPGLSRFGDFFFPFSTGPRPPKGEEVAEVGLFPVRDILALWLPALIMSIGVVEGAVEATMEVDPAVRARKGSRNPIGSIELLSTPVARFHDFVPC
jgi:hypothetical protein